MNAQLGRLFTIKHPNIFRFIDELRPHEFKKRQDMCRLLAIGCKKKQLQRKRKKDKEREEKIQFFTELLKHEKISVGLFLDAMSNKSILPYHGKILSVYSNRLLLLVNVQ